MAPRNERPARRLPLLQRNLSAAEEGLTQSCAASAASPNERRVMHLEIRMSDYKRVPTSAEVWAVIRARHPEMRVFGSYSAPDGGLVGDPSKGKMFTSYGFEHGDYPVIEAQTTWDIDPEAPYKSPPPQPAPAPGGPPTAGAGEPPSCAVRARPSPAQTDCCAGRCATKTPN